MFQSTHSLRSATQHGKPPLRASPVSIHALLAECDPVFRLLVPGKKGFNPRTPCGVRQVIVNGVKEGVEVSIHALLAECDQPWITSRPASCSFQSTHSLRSATLPGHMREPSTGVSIHALLAECDIALWSACSAVGCFNPRTPCGVRREGNAGAYDRPCFNPRTPCGVRRRLGSQYSDIRRFNPRTPCGVRPALRYEAI